MSTSRALIMIAGIAAALAVPAALGQSPLGDGTGLQKNNQGLQRNSSGLQRDLQVPGTGTPPPGTVRDFAAEVRFRNSIVTGNVGGGKAFRGNVGYTDPMDFRGKLGSDDLYTFKRDTLFSGAAGMGIRGTDALQYQFALSTGNTASAPASLAGSTLALGRGTAELAFNTQSPNAAATRRNDQLLIDGSLRSSSAYAAQRSLRPSFVGYRTPAAGEYERLMSSSPLGLQFQPWDTPEDFDLPGAKERRANSAPADTASTQRLLSTPFSKAVDRLAASPIATRAPVTAAPNTPLPGGTGNDPTQPKNSVPAADPGDSLSTLEKRLFNLRQTLSTDGRAAARKSAASDSNTLGNPIPDPLTNEDLKALRSPERAGTLVERTNDLAVKLPPVADLYLEHMKKGQDLVKTGRFFDAEEHFAMALAAHPGDLPALVGRLHAQIAGGLTVSAASNFRRTFADHPEAIGITYTDALLGGAERGDSVRQNLRTNITNGLITGESGLILAYLGYQQGDAGAADVAAGLDAFAASIAARKTAGADAESIAADEAFLNLLRGVWQK